MTFLWQTQNPEGGGSMLLQCCDPILEALHATMVFRKNRISESQKIALQLFQQVCQNQKLPLAIGDEQLRVYLITLYNMNFLVATVALQWRPIYDIIVSSNFEPNDKICNLFDFIHEQATPRRDKKLPVSHILLNQQIEALDAFIAPGYENILVKAMLARAWAAQLRVSEYTSKLTAHTHARINEHNLSSNGILVQEDGMTLVFVSDKTSWQCKERFLPWNSVPINNFKTLIQAYDKIRIKKRSPVYFCHEDGTNLTPNDMSDWIDLSLSLMDWKGLKIMLHCYRIGGTSYKYRMGLDIPSIQRSGRWTQSDNTTVEHYIKPGLYSTPSDVIHETLPQYKQLLTLTRMIYLRDCVTTPGNSDHPFNEVLKAYGFLKLQRAVYPTARAKQVLNHRRNSVVANKYLKEVEHGHSVQAMMMETRKRTSKEFKAQF